MGRSSGKNLLLSFTAMITPRIIIASIVVAIGWVLGRFFGRFISYIIRGTGVEKSFGNTHIGKRLSKAGYSLSYFLT